MNSRKPRRDATCSYPFSVLQDQNMEYSTESQGWVKKKNTHTHAETFIFTNSLLSDSFWFLDIKRTSTDILQDKVLIFIDSNP